MWEETERYNNATRYTYSSHTSLARVPRPCSVCWLLFSSRTSELPRTFQWIRSLEQLGANTFTQNHINSGILASAVIAVQFNRDSARLFQCSFYFSMASSRWTLIELK